MIRWSILAAGAVLVVGATLVVGSSTPPRPLNDHGSPDVKSIVVGEKMGFFNIAHVMREYRRARVMIDQLNARRIRMTGNVQGLKQLSADMASPPERVHNADDNSAQQGIRRTVDKYAEQLQRESNRLLNEQANTLIASFYDEIHATAKELAREHRLVALFAYPDAVTAKEMDDPIVKQLKLKPQAAQPFYLDPSVDYTNELIKRLNARFEAEPGGR